MITTNIPISSSISAVKAKVDIYNGTTLVQSCTCSEHLQDFIVSREGDTSKFFGFGVIHKVALSLIDINYNLEPIEKGYTIKIGLGDGTNFDYPFPTFYISEISREEKTRTTTITAYDTLYKASMYTTSSIKPTANIMLSNLVMRCALTLGIDIENLIGIDDEAFNIIINQEANFAGDEPLRAALNAIAEATQTIYYINNNDYLVFKRLDKDGEPVFTVTKDMYYELTTQTKRTLTRIVSATELGDNLYAGESGAVVQYVRDNPFWVVDTNLDNTLNEAAERILGLTITQLECEWEGNHLLEIGDKVAFVTEDDSLVNCFILDDTIDYQGYINQITAWEYTEGDTTASGNPTSIGDKINQTVAKVDKVNKEITLMVSDVNETKNSISELQLRSDEIVMSVSSLETTTNDYVEALNNNIETLTQEVNLKVDSSAVSIVVGQVLSEGVDKVVTASKKYTFDDNGLEISSSDSEIETLITEDGMTIYKNNSEVLTADNKGVQATDLHARTYLIIGENSRLEDKGNRTACFWIGPAGG